MAKFEQMKGFTIGLIFFAMAGCKDYEEDIRGIPVPAEVEASIEDIPDVEEQARVLRDGGYETIVIEEEDSSYLMQKYFMVLLKKGPN